MVGIVRDFRISILLLIRHIFSLSGCSIEISKPKWRDKVVFITIELRNIISIVYIGSFWGLYKSNSFHLFLRCGVAGCVFSSWYWHCFFCSFIRWNIIFPIYLNKKEGKMKMISNMMSFFPLRSLSCRTILFRIFNLFGLESENNFFGKNFIRPMNPISDEKDSREWKTSIR